MNTPNKVLMQQARGSLKDKWGNAVVATLIVGVVAIVANIIPGVGGLVGALISGPLLLGSTMYWLSLARGGTPELGILFKGFNYFVNAFVTCFLMGIFIFLWTLLLIVPGIIAAYAYSMTFFILADDPTLRPREAITKSKQMMQGNKWKFFLLSLRFIGWTLLACLTFGIGFLWLVPYMKVSTAKFYDDIKDPMIEESEAGAGAVVRSAIVSDSL